MTQPSPVLKPLRITCTSTDCDNNLHCFLQKTKAAPRHGPCRSCQADLVDWPRVHICDLADVQNTIAELQKEYIRHHFWKHVAIDQKAINHARRKGLNILRQDARKLIQTSVGADQPYRDGYQTPMKGKVLYYAQHATAACCRKCIEEWHGVPMGRELEKAEVDYLSELLILYVQTRMPDLQPHRIHVPYMRGRRT